VLGVSVGIVGPVINQQLVTYLGPCHNATISCEESAPHGTQESLGAWETMWAQILLEVQGHLGARATLVPGVMWGFLGAQGP
jgi:hypothetical protein